LRTRVIERLSRDEERRLIDIAYRLTGVRGLLIKTLFQTGARVSEFVAIEVGDFFFDEQMILIRKAKGGQTSLRANPAGAGPGAPHSPV
jgi:integrase/recombinase XerD